MKLLAYGTQKMVICLPISLFFVYIYVFIYFSKEQKASRKTSHLANSIPHYVFNFSSQVLLVEAIFHLNVCLGWPANELI